MSYKPFRNITAGLYGNALEWFDFLLYASFAPIFSDLFFPNQHRFVALLSTFGVFAIGFLMRPLGGWLLGHYADRIGRKKALLIAIRMMTFSTFAMAFLPTHAILGAGAALLFTLCRIIQGLAMGGELPNSATFLIEHMPPQRRGLAGSLVMSTAFFGNFLGSLVAALLSFSMSLSAMSLWGWRLAYLCGGLLGIVGIYLRKHSKETPYFKEPLTKEMSPAKRICLHHPRSLLLGIIYVSALALGNYILIAFATSFLVKYQAFTLSKALTVNLLALLVLTALIPFSGWLSDKIGRKPIIITSMFLLIALTFPIFYLLQKGAFHFALLAEILLAFALAPINATLPTLLAENFPTLLRATGTALTYNIGQALFGGTAPLIAFALIHYTDNNYAPAWYVCICTSIVLLLFGFYKETFKKAL